MTIFYKPPDGVCADFIPHYNSQDGTFELYYLHDYRDIEGKGEGCPWYLLTTKNLTDFREEGEVLPRGTREEQDLYAFTGCVLDTGEERHLFYTGHNHHLAETGGRAEAVMHAVSQDGKQWVKQPEDTFFAPEDPSLEKNDWRDPFVFWNEEEGCYWMLLCTRKTEGPSRRRGMTGLLVSDDLRAWVYKGSLWDPGICWCPECPDIFRWGEHWYLLYSTYVERDGMRTHYRMADSPLGPWRNPGDGTLDSRAFYAGKTAFDGRNRYLFGWNPTKAGEADAGAYQWGGHLVIHKLVQEPDGHLSTAIPETLEARFTGAVPVEPANPAQWIGEGCCRISRESGFAAAAIKNVPDGCMISFDVTLREDTACAGLMIHTGEDLEKGYMLRLEQTDMVFDSTDRVCEHPEIRRRIPGGRGRRHRISLLMEGTVFLAYLDNRLALSARMYDLKGPCAAFYVQDGEASFENVQIKEYK